MGSKKVDKSILSDNSMVQMEEQIAQITALQKQMIEDAKKLVSSEEIMQIQNSFKKYESEVKALQKKVLSIHKQYFPITEHVRELIEQSVKVSQKIEGYNAQSTKQMQREINKIREQFNVKVSTSKK